MAVLKQIKFGNNSYPLAQTQVAIDTNSNKALSVSATNTNVGDNDNPTYTIGLAVDGKTITKNGNSGLATALHLAYHAAVTEGTKKGAYIALEDNQNTVLSEIAVSNLVGNGILDSAEYDSDTGILTLTFKNAAGGTDDVTIDLGDLFDINDIVIKDDSTKYLSFELTNPAYVLKTNIVPTETTPPRITEEQYNELQNEEKEKYIKSDSGTTGQAQLSAKIVKLNNSTANNTGLVDSYDAKTYVDTSISNVGISGEGDNYITVKTDPNNNKNLIISADVTTMLGTAGTAGQYDSSGKQTKAPSHGDLTGTAKSLPDSSVTATAVKTYVDGEIAIEAARSDAKALNTVVTKIADLDAEVGSTTVASGKHVAVKVVETDGKLTNLTVTEKDIADAGTLSDYVTRATTAEAAIDAAVGLTKAQGLEDRTFTPTTNYGSGSTSVVDNLQKIDTQLKSISDSVAGVKYDVNGTTLEFFGITKATPAPTEEPTN